MYFRRKHVETEPSCSHEQMNLLFFSSIIWITHALKRTCQKHLSLKEQQIAKNHVANNKYFIFENIHACMRINLSQISFKCNLIRLY